MKASAAEFALMHPSLRALVDEIERDERAANQSAMNRLLLEFDEISQELFELDRRGASGIAANFRRMKLTRRRKTLLDRIRKGPGSGAK